MNTVRDIKDTVAVLADGDIVKDVAIYGHELQEMAGFWREIRPVDGLFYLLISEITDREVTDDSQFFQLIRELAVTKKAYDKIAPGHGSSGGDRLWHRATESLRNESGRTGDLPPG